MQKNIPILVLMLNISLNQLSHQQNFTKLIRLFMGKKIMREINKEIKIDIKLISGYCCL